MITAIHADILHNFKHNRIIGERHTAYENVYRGFARHHAKQVKQAATDLIREELLIAKPTSYGLQVSLNPDKIEEIDAIIEAFQR